MPDAPTVRASVCLAAHDGAAHIEEQLTSILEQLGAHDEVVVVDDASTDATVAVVEAIGDPRIRLVRNEINAGYVRTFERAMTLSRGAFVLLSDQDDVWVPGRLDAMLDALASTAVVATSVAVLGEPLQPPRWPLRASDSTRHVANVVATMIGVRCYTGCAMGLRRDILSSALPIPAWVDESHDLWFALVGNTHRQMTHLEPPSVTRRLHDANQTPLHWRSLRVILRARWMLARALVVAVRRSSTWRPTGPTGPTAGADMESKGPRTSP